MRRGARALHGHALGRETPIFDQFPAAAAVGLEAWRGSVRVRGIPSGHGSLPPLPAMLEAPPLDPWSCKPGSWHKPPRAGRRCVICWPSR